MTVGSGLAHSANEKDPLRQSSTLKQILEGRSNAVGMTTLTHDGSATTTTVTAPNCGPNSIVFLAPLTDWAAASYPTTYVQKADISAGQFIITHQPTSNATETFGWICLG
jgi:hypothetical protein